GENGPLGQALVGDALRPGGEPVARPLPAQLLGPAEEIGVASQRGQVLEQEGQLAALAEHLAREVLDPAVLVHEPGRGDLADAGDARVAVGAVADEREQVGDAVGPDAELLADAVDVADRAGPAVDLYHAVAAHGLGQILVGRPDADLVDVVVAGGDAGGGGERVVGLELHHRPDGNPHRGE